MDAATTQWLQHPYWVNSEKFPGKSTSSFLISARLGERKKLMPLSLVHAQAGKTSNRHASVPLEVLCSNKNAQASLLETEGVHAPCDEALILKNRTQEIEPYLNGQSIYLVGMMGSGKTTVGKLISQGLGYSFFDCDTLIEEAMNGTTVAEIFELYGESFFRDKETETLQKLSAMHQLVVSTGGGAVIRPINWKYMHKGISVWLDVPLEALAQRIAAVGTDSRPLLHQESGDAYTTALKRLSTIWEERGEAYTNANARVSLESIAAKSGYEDVCDLTPTAIAIEALEQIELFLKQKGGVAATEL